MQGDRDVWKRWLPAFVFALALIIIFKILDNITGIWDWLGNLFRIVSPFLFGILIVYFLYVPARKLEEWCRKSKNKIIAKKARLFSVLSIYIILVAGLVLVATLVAPMFWRSVVDLIQNIPDYYMRIISIVPDDYAWNGVNLKGALVDFSQNTLSNLLEQGRIEQLFRGVFMFATGIFNVIISLIVSLYILLEREKISKFFNDLSDSFFKEKTKRRLNKYLGQVNDVLFTFIGSKGLDSLINTVAITTILLVLDVRYAFLLGFVGGIMNFIPYLGSLIAGVLIVLVTLITGGPVQAVWTAVAVLIFQQIDANFIEPKIMGRSLKISPLLVIFAVVVGGAYFGIVGMFLAVPIATIIKQVLVEYMAIHKERKSGASGNQN